MLGLKIAKRKHRESVTRVICRRVSAISPRKMLKIMIMCLMAGYKNFLPKRTKNKMSSVMPFVFNGVELCVVTINEKLWTCTREVCKVLEYNKKTTDIV